PEGHPEAVAERRRQQPGSGRRPYQGERRQVERQRARGGALADDDVEAEVLERRAGDRPDPDAELLADDEREARLPEAGRPDEQHVVERLAPRRCSGEHHLELRAQPLLSDELTEAAGPKRAIELVLRALVERRRQQPLRHAALRSAWRTRSSGASSGSTSARARSASTSE